MGPYAPNILKSDLITGSLGILIWHVKTLLKSRILIFTNPKKVEIRTPGQFLAITNLTKM